MNTQLSYWLRILYTVGLAALSASPLAAIAAPVAAAIAAAEAIKGASGKDKLAHVTEIAVQAAEVAKTQGVLIDPAEVKVAADKAISTAVDVVNLVNKAHPTPAPVIPPG